MGGRGVFICTLRKGRVFKWYWTLKTDYYRIKGKHCKTEAEWVQEEMQKSSEMTLPGKTLAVAVPSHLLMRL